jgi:VanZ family protein
VPIAYTDVIVHFGMFFVFSAALFLDITNKRTDIYKRILVVLITIFVSFGLGFITELLQFLIIPLNRTGTLGDLLSDFAGALAGTAVMAVIKRRSSVAP